MSSKHGLTSELRDLLAIVQSEAQKAGLDCFNTVFEMISYEQMNEIASYGGFPVRYPHWRFGMEYERLAKSYEYGLSKIYELVINNTPSVAYLLEGNSYVEQKLVMAHVFGHVDFFKNNFCFTSTDQGRDARTGEPIRKWIDTMANHGAIVRRWAGRVGIDNVESFIDACLSLENLVDMRLMPKASSSKQSALREFSHDGLEDEPAPSVLRVDRDYMESFVNPTEFVEHQRKKEREQREKKAKFPVKPERDVVGFLIDHAPLEKWEHDILTVIRNEAIYFVPQMQTKIMNEGWASYWHSRLMTEKLAQTSEIIDYAERNASVMATGNGQLNPYKLGVELFRHIEERWNKGQFGKAWDDCDELEARKNWDLSVGLGREKIFEVRKHYNDVNFIDEFLTPDFVAEQKLYSFGFNERNDRWEIETRQFEEVKQKLLFRLTNAGQPIICVEDANAHNQGVLSLRHGHDGFDLRMDYAQEVLRNIYRIWRRPVELFSKTEDKEFVLRFDGAQVLRQDLAKA